MKSFFIVILIVGLYACANDPEPITPPLPPVAKTATDITSDSFTANWQSSLGANGYELDIATDDGFTNIIDSLKGFALGAVVIDSLEGNTDYFYRVRATVDGAHASENSNVISLITLPSAPVATTGTNVTSNSFTANWQEVAGITTYLLYVSWDDFPASPPNNLPGYNGLELTGTSHDISGLDTGTDYFYVVKSKTGTRVSGESNSIYTPTRN